MTRRVVIGKRASGDYGVFVSPAGIDAYTAADSQLLLNISNRVPALLQLGAIGSSQTVYMGLTIRPIVVIFSSSSLASIPGYGAYVGPARPSPLFNSDPQAYADIAADGSYMNITCGARLIYAVYNYQF